MFNCKCFVSQVLFRTEGEKGQKIQWKDNVGVDDKSALHQAVGMINN